MKTTKTTHKIGVALTTLALAATVTAATAIPAQADATYHDKVGFIEGWYVPAPTRDYQGTFSAAPDGDGYCVVVQRKSGGGVWTTNYVYMTFGSACQGEGSHYWEITNDAKVSDTVAIRLYENGTGSYINLCNTKAQCLDMRKN